MRRNENEYKRNLVDKMELLLRNVNGRCIKGKKELNIKQEREDEGNGESGEKKDGMKSEMARQTRVVGEKDEDGSSACVYYIYTYRTVFY